MTEKLRLADDGIDQRIRFARTRDVFVKTAVGTNLQTEGDVDVEVARMPRHCRGVCGVQFTVFSLWRVHVTEFAEH